MNLNNKLKLMSLNCNGITNKIDEILDFYNNVDLFCFQEHWLSTEECLPSKPKSDNCQLISTFYPVNCWLKLRHFTSY